jgi:predicted PurR-regulated permease PerM
VVILLYGLLNFAIDYFISPYLVGKTSGVHPMVLLLFVLMGSFVFGIWGALLTVPAILIIKTISTHYINRPQK